MSVGHLDSTTVQRLHANARAERWDVSLEAFARALDRGVEKAFPGAGASPAEIARHCGALHLEDLALACACAEGKEAAWEHFVREFRPVLYRAAGALDPSGGARDLADALYGELFGLTERDGRRRSHFEYFHGRSSLATWLRSVLAQRHVDRIRVVRREDPLPADAPDTLAAPPASDAGTIRRQHVRLLKAALAAAVAALTARDRLRLACYHAQGLTLAAIGRMLGEHEATVSRHLTRTRQAVRRDVERWLRETARLGEAAVAECIGSALEDPGDLSLSDLLEIGRAHV